MNNKKSKGIISSIAGAVVLLLVYFLQGGNPTEERVESVETSTQETVMETEDGSDSFEEETQNNENLDDQENDTPEMEVYYEEEVEYTFRNEQLLEEHYEKHGIEMGFDSMEEYEAAAVAVILNEDALYKTEEEDGDGVYYIEETNEFVVLSQDGYIRTYFYPSDGIEYFERQ